MKPIVLDDFVSRLGRWSAGRGPLYLLLAGRLRQLIDDGDLPAGTPLPPDRTLAAALAVGRTTVIAAYDLLRQESAIVRRQGSGTQVASTVSLSADRPNVAGTANAMFLQILEPPDHTIQLVCAAPGAMPGIVAEAYEKAMVQLTVESTGYYPAGEPALRATLAERYARRGLATEPDQILVTTGAQQALSLLARRFLSPGEKVIVEAPTYPGALEVFRESAAVLRSVPAGGADPEPLIAAMREHRPALAYVIPSYQNPTGAVLPPLARRRLAETAAGLGVPLVDDEALADLGFDEDDLPPLASFASGGITVGSLSKLVWGGLRVGWVRAPASEVTRLARLKAVGDLGSNVPAQLAAAELLSGIVSLRARRAAELRERHDHLCAELARLLPDWVFRPVSGGQTLWIRLPRGDGASFAQAALRYGVAVLPGGFLDVSGGSDNFLRVPFLAPLETLSDGVRRLADAWRSYPGVQGTAASLNAVVV